MNKKELCDITEEKDCRLCGQDSEYCKVCDDSAFFESVETGNTLSFINSAAIHGHTNYWRKFPADKPLADQICIVAAGPGRVAQHVALRWDEDPET